MSFNSQPSTVAAWGTKLALFALFVAAGSGRLLDHAPNLALLGTLSFVAGRYWPGRRGALLPLLAAVISDFLIGFYDRPVMLTVWASYLLVWQLGRLARRVSLRPLRWGPTLANLGLAASGSILFFLLTNGAVWLAGWYEPTARGLVACYLNALPFLRNSLVSDISGSVIMLTVLEGIASLSPRRLGAAVASKRSAA